jgi:hypothetical protein
MLPLPERERVGRWKRSVRFIYKENTIIIFPAARTKKKIEMSRLCVCVTRDESTNSNICDGVVRTNVRVPRYCRNLHNTLDTIPNSINRVGEHGPPFLGCPAWFGSQFSPPSKPIRHISNQTYLPVLVMTSSVTIRTCN